MKTTIKFKSLLAGIKDIEERNKAFYKLTKQQKRQEIAWDCLNLIVRGTVKGARGAYWNNRLIRLAKKTETSNELQKMLVDNLPTCAVCARGGMMLSQIRLSNKLKPNFTCGIEGKDKMFDSSITNGSDEKVKSFTMGDFYKMEKEYEYCEYEHPYGIKSTNKLANICCNVIVNGNFNISDKTNYLKV